MGNQWDKTVDNVEEKYHNKNFIEEANRLCKEHGSFLAYLKTLTPIAQTRTCVNSDEYSATICGVQVFIKTFARRLWPIRFFYGGHCIENEYRANAKIREKNLARVAMPYARPRRDTAIFQYIPNSGHLENPLHHENFAIPPKAFFQELIDYIHNLHKNGICHGDIRRANILIGEDGHPWLVDTASAYVLPDKPNIIQRQFFKSLARSDMFSLAKIVFSYYPDWQNDTLKNAYENQSFLLKTARYAHYCFNALLRRKKRKKKLKI